jgi:hypothetical protein
METSEASERDPAERIKQLITERASLKEEFRIALALSSSLRRMSDKQAELEQAESREREIHGEARRIDSEIEQLEEQIRRG